METFSHKPLSETLREIDALTTEIQQHYPELYLQLTTSPIPLPEEFYRQNNPCGLETYLENVKLQLIHQISNQRKLCFN